MVPASIFKGAKAGPDVTPIYDYDALKDEVLCYRVSVVKDRAIIGYTDIAANSAFSHPLIRICPGGKWDEKSLLKQASAKAKEIGKGRRFNKVHFVVYSYPKLAVQFLLKRKEVAMLDFALWKEVPQERQRKRGELPGNFERWSLIKETPPERHQRNFKNLRDHILAWEPIRPPSKESVALFKGYVYKSQETVRTSENVVRPLTKREKQAFLTPPSGPRKLRESLRPKKLLKSGGPIESRSKVIRPSKTTQNIKFNKLQYSQIHKVVIRIVHALNCGSKKRLIGALRQALK